MAPDPERRVCLIPKLEGVGGMVSFQHKLATGLRRRGIGVSFDLKDEPYQAVLVIGGTRQLAGLWRARRRGVPIVQRLDGMNWMHRVPTQEGKLRTNLRHYLRAEYGNFLLSLIRGRLADRIVYQSEFSQRWWERVYGETPAPSQIVYNGVDLERFSPEGVGEPPGDRWRVLLVEGSLMGGYELGLEAAAGLASGLAQRMGDWDASHSRNGVELVVAGRVSPEVRQHWEGGLKDMEGEISLTWAGLVPHEDIPRLDRSAHVLYSSDINAACPNSVIEALACGLPVVSFDTGALPELVSDDAGRIAPYGGDPWKLEAPDIGALVGAAAEILQDQARFRRGARKRAERFFGLEAMTESYLQALL